MKFEITVVFLRPVCSLLARKADYRLVSPRSSVPFHCARIMMGKQWYFYRLRTMRLRMSRKGRLFVIAFVELWNFLNSGQLIFKYVFFSELFQSKRLFKYDTYVES